MSRVSSITFDVAEVLKTDERSRDNDKRLIRLVYERKGLPTNLYDIENMKNIPSFASIVRARRKLQEINPLLKGKFNKKELEKEYREFSRL